MKSLVKVIAISSISLLALVMPWNLKTMEIARAVAEEKIVRTLSVTGQGTVNIPSTEARVSLGVEVRGKTANEVQQEVAKRSNAVVNLLKSRQVNKLQTTGISLQPEYDYNNPVGENRQPRLIGYIGANNVSFRSSIDQSGSIIDEAVKIGATRIDSISFLADDEEIAKAQREALKKAALDAQLQADTVLGSLNLTRRDIIGIQLNNAYSPTPLYMQNAQITATDRLSNNLSPVIAGEQVVTASVTLQISY
jgi:uncharacterized protein